MNKLSMAIIAGLSVVNYAVLAHDQDPEPAPMLKESYLQKQHDRLNQPAKPLMTVTAGEFTKAYSNLDRPKLALFVGQRFDDHISDWYANRRVRVQVHTEGNQHTRLPSELNANIAAERRVVDMSARSAMLTVRQWSEFDRGFEKALLSHQLRLLNQGLAMRLLDSDLRASEAGKPTNDGQHLEIDMLRKHAPLLIEVMPFANDRREQQPIAFNVRLTDLKQAITLMSQDLYLPLEPTNWRGQSGGYAQRTEQSLDRVNPQRGGYQLQEEQTFYWQEQGEKVAQGVMQVLYDAYLAQ